MGVMTEAAPSVDATTPSSESRPTNTTLRPLDLVTVKSASTCETGHSASDRLEHRGADLLLSLAETASEHAKHRNDYINDCNGVQGVREFDASIDRNNSTNLPIMSSRSDANELLEGDLMSSTSLNVKPAVTPSEGSRSEMDQILQTSCNDTCKSLSPHQSPILIVGLEANMTSSTARSLSSDTTNRFSSLETTQGKANEQNYGSPLESIRRTINQGNDDSPGIHRKRFAYTNYHEEKEETKGNLSSLNVDTTKSSTVSSVKDIGSEQNQNSPVVEPKVLISPSSSNERSEDGDDHHSESCSGQRKKMKQDSTNENDDTNNIVPKNLVGDPADANFQQAHLRHINYQHPAANFYHHSSGAPRPPHPPHYMYLVPPFAPGAAMPHYAYSAHSPSSPYLAPSYYANPNVYGARMPQPGHMYASPQHYPNMPMYGNVVHTKATASSVPDSSSTQSCRSSPTKVELRTKKSVGKNISSPYLAVPGKLRCAALKNPVSSSPSLRNGNQVDNIKIPDFMLLVNYPDYLARGRSGRADLTHGGEGCLEGKKNCVMCGKLRICSANSATMSCKKGTPKESSQNEESESTHIIPRQNKGVCTACDVAVWVVLKSEDQLEIKWCKGCKNFRPWMSFGDKGMATKCVRCRNRQKEKYANQKKENILNNNRTEWEVKSDATELERDAAALKGLQHLRKTPAN